MRHLWMLGLAASLSTSVGAESVRYDAVTTFDAELRTCQSVQFGPDAAGFDKIRDQATVSPYTAVLLMVRVTQSWTRSFDGQPVAKVPPPLLMPAGDALVLLEGTADTVCAKLRQPTARMRLMQSDCDTIPRRGRCLAPYPIRWVELAD